MQLQQVLSLVRKACEDYNMIEEGDKIAVGISGGKDSLTLLSALAHLRRFYPKKFELYAITVDLGFDNLNLDKITEFCRDLDVEYTIVKTDIANIIFNERKEKNPHKDDYYEGWADRHSDVSTGKVNYYDSDGNIIHSRQLDGKWGGKYYLGGQEVTEAQYRNKTTGLGATSLFVSQKYSGSGSAVIDSIDNWAKSKPSVLSSALNSSDSYLTTGSNQIRFLDANGNTITDRTQLEAIKAYIKDKYNLAPSENLYSASTTPSSVSDALNKYIEILNKYNVKLGNIPREAVNALESLKTGYGTEVEFRNKDTGAKQSFNVYGVASGKGGARYDISKFYNDPTWELSDFSFTVGGRQTRGTKSDFENWYSNSFLVRGFQMGGIPNTGELFVARENGKPEFVGSFGNKAAVANNEQIVTAVANGVSMANESIKNAIENQTNILADTINNKDVNVQIGDRQIAEANNRGQKGLGNRFVD